MPPQTLAQTTRVVIDVIRTHTGRAVDLGPDDALVTSGLLDSMSIVQLVHALAEGCGVALEPADLTAENFETVRAIQALIERTGWE